MTIDHSVSSGGYFCQVFNRAPLSEIELTRLDERMREIVKADIPFTREEVPLNEVIAYFEKKGYHDKVRLLQHRKKEHLVLYNFGNHRDYHHGYMVPSSGYLKWFGLTPTGEGFTLRFPRRHRPTELLPMPDFPTLLATFQQYGDWLQRMGVDSVGALNEMIRRESLSRDHLSFRSPARTTDFRYCRNDREPQQGSARGFDCGPLIFRENYIFKAPFHPTLSPGNLSLPRRNG